MGTEDLQQALDDCVINFDRRVLLTDLLQDYELPYAEVDKILSDHIAQQEKKGAKFEKRFLISGTEEDSTNEVYTIVHGETKLREWLRKLKNAESALYSVETSGGAKSPADIFQPMKWCANLKQVETRTPLKWGASNGTTNETTKTEVKKEEKKPKGLNFAPKQREEASTSNQPNIKSERETKKSSPPAKKTTPESKQPTPEEQKTSAAKSNNKKGIASFFGAASSNNKTETKKAAGVIKPPTPKKMQDFFKKTDKTVEAEKAMKQDDVSNRKNTSVQLFSTEDDDKPKNESEDQPHTVVDVDTSDDEAELKALRLECAGSDDEDAPSSSSMNKRRRIMDSDDEEPQVKHEKKNEDESMEISDSEENKAANMSESYLDEDGFVVTVKAKKSTIPKKPVKKEKTPEKSSPKKDTKKKATKDTSKVTATKTKQGNIMSFFTKK